MRTLSGTTNLLQNAVELTFNGMASLSKRRKIADVRALSGTTNLSQKPVERIFNRMASLSLVYILKK